MQVASNHPLPPLNDLPRNNLPALLEHPHLPRYLPQSRDDFSIPLGESVDRIRNTRFRTEVSHKRLRFPQIVSRDPGEQVVDGLELEAAVDKIQPGGAVDVHGRAQHFLWEGLVHAHVCGGHGEVAERDLDVERGGDHVGDHDEDESVPGGGDGQVDNQVAEPGPEDELAEHF